MDTIVQGVFPSSVVKMSDEYTEVVLDNNITFRIDGNGVQMWDIYGTHFEDIITRATDVHGANIELVLRHIKEQLDRPDDDYLDDNAYTLTETPVDFWEHLRRMCKNPEKQKIHIVSWGDKFYKTPPVKPHFNAKTIGSKKPRNLRDLRGTDESLQRTIQSAKGFEFFMETIIKKIEADELKVVGIFCTAGHHRSVACAELLKKHVYTSATIQHLTLRK